MTSKLFKFIVALISIFTFNSLLAQNCGDESLTGRTSKAKPLTLEKILAIKKPGFSAKRVSPKAVLIRTGTMYQMATTDPIELSPLYPVAFGPTDMRYIPHYRYVPFDRKKPKGEMFTEAELMEIDHIYRPRVERIPAVIQIIVPGGLAYLTAYFHGVNVIEPDKIDTVSFTPLLKILGPRVSEGSSSNFPERLVGIPSAYRTRYLKFRRTGVAPSDPQVHADLLKIQAAEHRARHPELPKWLSDLWTAYKHDGRLPENPTYRRYIVELAETARAFDE